MHQSDRLDKVRQEFFFRFDRINLGLRCLAVDETPTLVASEGGQRLA